MGAVLWRHFLCGSKYPVRMPIFPDISSQLKIGSGTMVVLSSATAIKEVVDKHGWTGSSRPSNYIAELCGSGGEFNILFATDCVWW